MNKPVAWYKKDSNDYLIENIGQPDFQVQEFIDAGYIPLYTHPANACKHGVDDGACKECYLEATHPVKVNYEFNSSQVKELTDEEILREWVDATYLDASQCTDDIKDFARAIARKAQK